MRVLVVNGPNLNLLGTRRPDLYGTTTLGELEARCRDWGRDLDLDVVCFQSNHEGAIVDRLHAARDDCAGVVINPGALTHTSYVLHDAIEAIALPTVEVHISDIGAREEWRRVSVIRPVVVEAVTGEGIEGYRTALRRLAEHLGG
ncbi:MAG: type II 3-dehydroquinate dehydratase [Acidimicrobiia bacterium]|nr:type II 3-dehydroquinate dehydratase [Acidimicrobiia bacterium]